MESMDPNLVNLANSVAQVVTAIAAVVGLTIGVLQLRGSRRDAQAARMADLSWQIYQACESNALREGRRALNTVSRSRPLPHTEADYGAMYVIHTYQGKSGRRFASARKVLPHRS